MTMRYRIRLLAVGVILGTCGWAAAQDKPKMQGEPIRLTRTGVESAPAATQPTEDTGGRLELSSKEFDFGEVWQGAPATKDFTIKNAGTGPLSLALKSTCGCTLLSKVESPLAAGKSATFSIAYQTSSYPGAADKRVLLTTNDPGQARVEIVVKGKVKPLFKYTPANRVMFQHAGSGERLDKDAVVTQTIKLENEYDKPLALKLKEGEDYGRFEVEFKELKPGKEFDLKVTTKPPLQWGWSRAQVTLETGLELVPTLSIPLGAFVQPRVMCIPRRLNVSPEAMQPTEQTLRLQYQAAQPIKITDVKANLSGFKYELLPPSELREGSQLAALQIRVTLPAFVDIPEEGAKLEIFTDDKDPEYQRFEIPINRGKVRSEKPPIDPAEARGGPIRPLPAAISERIRRPRENVGEALRPTTSPASQPAQPEAPKPEP